MGLFSKKKKEPEVKPVVQEPPKNTVKVTDIDGSEFEVALYQMIDSSDRVLVADGGRTYHTHLSCFKRWTGDAQRNFTGWKIVKKSDVVSQGMKYCKFCADDDNVTLDDFLNDEE